MNGLVSAALRAFRRVPPVLLALCVSTAAAQDASPRALTRTGNQNYEAGKFREALEAYERAADTSGADVPPEILHNQAAAHYKLGELERARDLWVRAAARKDAAFEALARYNLGNCDLLAADAAARQGAQEGAPLEDTMNRLDAAIANYRDALRLDASLEDARANLELAARLKKQLEESAESQPSSQPSSQPQEGGEQNQEQDQQQPQSQPSSQPSSQPQEGQDSDPGEDPNAAENPPQDSRGEQEESEQDPSEPEEGEEPQPQTQPGEQEEGEEPQPQSQPAEATEGQEQPPVPIHMTEEQAARLLQMIRDMEQQRRERLRAAERGRQRPVERDW